MRRPQEGRDGEVEGFWPSRRETWFPLGCPPVASSSSSSSSGLVSAAAAAAAAAVRLIYHSSGGKSGELVREHPRVAKAKKGLRWKGRAAPRRPPPFKEGGNKKKVALS